MRGRRDAYDDFWDLYPAWVESAGLRDLDFYVELYAATDGPVCELGVGDGRIAVPAAARGARVLGVDGSPRMLERLALRATAAGVAERITPIEADLRDFELPEPPALVAVPFHSIGHLLSLDDKRACLERVFATLPPGGRFVFDHFVPDPAYLHGPRVPALRAEYTSPETGRDGLIWATATHDVEAQTMRLFVRSEELDADGRVADARYRRLDFSWIEPDQARALLDAAGFEVEDLFGDFEGNAFHSRSDHQVWIARKPA